MVAKSSSVLAIVVHAAFLWLAPLAVAATDPLMPTGPGGGQPDNGTQPFDSNPAAPGSVTSQVLTYGIDSDGNTVPTKTLRITNNTASTVYPIMRDPNSNTIQGSDTVGLYNPSEPAEV